jgi:chromosome segregation ATPase
MLMEVEILPISEHDLPNRYIISTLSVADKLAWLDAYKCLVRYNVKSKNLSDVTMTSSSADKGGEDDDEKGLTEDEAPKTKRAADAKLEEENQELKAKIDLFEKRMLEKDEKIKEWELKVQNLSSEIELKEKDLKSQLQAKENDVAAVQLDLKNSQQELEQSKKDLEMSKEESDKLSNLCQIRFVEISELKEKLEKQSAQLSTAMERSNGIQSELELTISQQSKTINQLESLADKNEIAIEELKTQISEKDSVVSQMKSDNQMNIHRINEIMSLMGNIATESDVTHGSVSLSLPVNAQYLGSTYGLRDKSMILSATMLDRPLSEKLEQCRKAVMELVYKHSEKQSLIENNTKNIASLQTQIMDLKTEIMGKAAKIKENELQLEFSNKKLHEYEGNNGELLRKIEDLRAKLVHSEDEFVEAKKKWKKYTEEQEQTINDLKSNLSMEGDSSRSIQKQIRDLKNLCQDKDLLIEELNANGKKLSDKVKYTESTIVERDVMIKELQDRIEKYQAVIQEIELMIKQIQEAGSISYPNSSLVPSTLKALVGTIHESWIKNIRTLQESSRKSDELENEIENLKKVIKSRKAENEDISLDFEKERESNKMLTMELNQQKEKNLKIELTGKSLRDELDKIKSEYESLKITCTGLEKKLQVSEANIQIGSNELRELSNSMKIEVSKHLATIKELEEDRKTALLKLKDKDNSLIDAIRQIKDLEIQISDMKSNLANMTSKQSQREEHLHKISESLAETVLFC